MCSWDVIGLKLPWIKIFLYRDQCLGYGAKKSTHQHKLQPLDGLPFLVAVEASQPQKTVNTTQALCHYVNRYIRLLVLLMCHHTEYSYMEVLTPRHCLL